MTVVEKTIDGVLWYCVSNADGNGARDLHDTLAGHLDGHIRLESDIDLFGYSWSPVGSSSAPFMGILDGNGKHITHGNIVLLEYIKNAQIKGVSFQNWEVTKYVIYNTNNYVYAVLCVNIGNSQIIQCEFENIKLHTLMDINSKTARLSPIAGYVSTGDSLIQDISIRNIEIIKEHNAFLLGSLLTFNKELNDNTQKISGINILIDGISYSLINTQNNIMINSASVGQSGANNWGASGRTNTMFNSIFRTGSTYGNIPFYSARFFGHYVGSTTNYYYSTASNCWHGEHATVNNVAYPSSGSDADLYGRPVAESTYNTRAFYETILGWDFDNTWYWDETDRLPKLRVFRRHNVCWYKNGNTWERHPTHAKYGIKWSKVI